MNIRFNHHARSLCTILLLLALLACSSSKSKDQAAPPPAEAIDWQHDIDYLNAELPARHKNLFFRLSEAEFRDRIARLRTTAPDLSDERVLAEISRIVAAVGDGHTRVALLWGVFGAVPLRLIWFEEGLYVVSVAAENEWANGWRVTRIGNRDIAQVIDDVTPLISHDNASQLRGQVPDHLISPEVLAALDLTPTYTLEANDGSARTLALSEAPSSARVEWVSALKPPLPLYMQNNQAHYWNAPVPGHSAVYLQYNKCADASDRPFADFATGMLAYLDQNNTERVIIDLRHNGGGSSLVIKPLIDGLAARERYKRPGSTFAIIGRNTFSSAVLNAIELRNTLGTILVGEPTGGKPNHYGEVRSLELPKSKVEVWYSTKLFNVVPGDPDAIDPDIAAPVTAASFFAPRDPALEAALSYQKK